MKWANLLALALALILLPGCEEPPETAETVLQKVLAAHGADGALEKVEGLLYHGHASSMTDENKGTLWILYRHPKKLRVSVELPEIKEDRLYLDGQGWSDIGRGFAPVSGVTLDLMKFQTEHLSLPFNLIEGKYRCELYEPVTGDKPIRLILTDDQGLKTNIAIDPVRWVIRTVEREVDSHGKKMVVAVLFEEYRMVKGVQLPHRVLNFVNGAAVGRTDFSTVQINPSIPEKIFSAPGSRAR